MVTNVKKNLPKTLSWLLILGLILPLLTACQGMNLPWVATFTPTPSQTPTPSSTPTVTATFSPTPSPTATFTPTPTPRPQARRVLIVSIDGLRPDAIAAAPMPTLQNLMQTGAYSLQAQTIFPSATLPSHTSMLSGMCPSAHGVLWNDYQPENGYAQGTSLFSLAKPYGLYTLLIVGKEKLRQITPPENLSYFRYINDRDLVIIEQALPELQKGFDLAVIHLPTTDGMGHEYGWMSPEQLSVLRRADEALANLLKGLEQAGLRDGTLLIVTADHGGHNQTHGSRDPLDMTIPWVVNGPGVVPGELTVDINTTDTAATAAWALRLPLPAAWVGLPVYEAFGEISPARPSPRCE